MVAIIVSILLWLGVAYGIFVTIGGNVFLWQQIHTYTSNEGRLFQFTIPKERRLLVWLAGLPDGLISAVAWPTVVLPILVRSFFVAMRTPSQTVAQYQSWMVEEGRKEWGRPYLRYLGAAVWGILLALGLLLLPMGRLPLLLWVGAFWGACVVWLVATYFTSLNFLRRVRLTPSHAFTNTLIMMLLFGFVFPLLTVALVATLEGQAVDYETIRLSILKIFTLRGLVWEGPQSTLATILEDPVELFYVLSGVLLYGSILSKIPQALGGSTSDEDLQMAAGTSLVLGRPKLAEELLRQMQGETLDSAQHLVIARLNQGDVEGAQRLAEAKFTFLKEYLRTPGIAGIGTVLVSASVWNLKPETQRTLVQQFLAAEPDEEELALAYFTLLGSKWHFPKEGILEYAEERGFLTVRFFIVLATQDKALLEQALEERKLHGSRHPAVQMLSDCYLARIILIRDPSLQEVLTAAIVYNMTCALEATHTGPGYFLLYLALQYGEALAKEDEGKRRALEDLRRKLLDRAALGPHGRRFATLLKKEGKVTVNF